MLSTILNNNSENPLSAGPVVFLLLDGWGVAPISEANAITSAKMSFVANLIKEYPVALLKTENLSLNARYLSMGAGNYLPDENSKVALSLSKILSDLGLKQIKITETERLAALTNFFNGHRETKLIGEEWRILSSEVSSHTPKPSFTLARLSSELIKCLNEETYNFLTASIPSLDLVASSGNLKSVKKVAEIIDATLERIVTKVLDKKGTIIISSACGNAENMKSMTTEIPDKEMTSNPVPLIIVGENFEGKTIGLSEPLNNDLSLLSAAGDLGDLAPTILDIMNISKPEEMTGNSILTNI